MDEDGRMIFSGFTDEEGRVLCLYHADNAWQNLPEGEYHLDEAYPDEAKAAEIREKAWEYMQQANPECLSGIQEIRMEWWLEKDGERYAEFMEDPLDQEGDGILLTVRTEPEWRVEYFSCVSNG